MRPAFFTTAITNSKTSNITPVLRLPITNYTMLYQLLKLSAIVCIMAETLRTAAREELLRSLLTPITFLVYSSVSQPLGRGPVPGPGINYTGPREVLLEFVILVF